MILARVLGNIVASTKNQRYDNASIMLCQQVTPEGDETAMTVLALNAVDAGVGDTVLIVQEGWGASTASTGKPGAAIDSAIVGVVDYVDLLKDDTIRKGHGRIARPTKDEHGNRSRAGDCGENCSSCCG